ncbi:MAG TPA: hypothetical protein VNN76_07190 [Bacteroidota bacterium]|nr:hypothetical protein [Bacteroidota bacterium]
MGVIIDLIGSMIVRGTIVVIVVTMMLQLHNTLYERNAQSIAQQKMMTVSDIITMDFKLLGYNVPVGTNPILRIESQRIDFLGDLGNNGTIDTIRYYMPVGDSVLYRQENNNLGEILHFVNLLEFQYFNEFGAYTAQVDSVKMIQVRIGTKEPPLFSDFRPSGYWETVFIPPNI